MDGTISPDHRRDCSPEDPPELFTFVSARDVDWSSTRSPYINLSYSPPELGDRMSRVSGVVLVGHGRLTRLVHVVQCRQKCRQNQVHQVSRVHDRGIIV